MLGLVVLGLVVCVTVLIFLGIRGDRLQGDDLQNMLKDEVTSRGGDPEQIASIQCAQSMSYGDGDTAECTVNDMNGDSATLMVRVFGEGDDWRLQVGVGE